MSIKDGETEMFTPLKAVVAAPSMVVLLVSSIAVGQQSAAGDTSVVKLRAP